MKTTNELYLDYVNNYLSVERFASAHDMSREEAERVIRQGRTKHEFNARLIALAPELLNAVRRLTHPMADDSDVDDALALLAKLEGQS